MKYRFPVFIGSEHSNSSDFMCPIDRQQYRVRRHFIGTSRSYHYLTTAYPTYKNNLADRNSLFFRKLFQAFRYNIAIFKSDNEHPADSPFTHLHISPP
jgi:hypothetical protein